jgi:release factor glutamine methyltransferase
MIRRIYKRIARHTLQPAVRWYLKKPRRYRHRGMEIRVLPGVFHPGFFISTKLLVRHLSSIDLHGKSLLELGCGSGMVSVFAALQGATVKASDINPKAVENALLNASLNGVNIHAAQSDLFQALPADPFDIVVINPPYYPREPHNDMERAWYCGAGFEYFEKLFSQLAQRRDGEILMILSEDCDVQRIREIGASTGFDWEIAMEANRSGERNWIFSLIRH